MNCWGYDFLVNVYCFVKISAVIKSLGTHPTVKDLSRRRMHGYDKLFKEQKNRNQVDTPVLCKYIGILHFEDVSYNLMIQVYNKSIKNRHHGRV